MENLKPKDVLLWTLRRNEHDVINLYDYLSSLMQLATSANMLNFGFWEDGIDNPVEAQTYLCKTVGTLSELNTAKNVLDIGSGFSEPSVIWNKQYPGIAITCLNTNKKQIQFAKKFVYKTIQKEHAHRISLINSSATKIPIKDLSFDRIIALESAQHFKPIERFFSESRRVLKDKGILTLAVPVLSNHSRFETFKMGILKFTWSSEHYEFKTLQKLLVSNNFDIVEKKIIGSKVYTPLAQYYIQNRESLRSKISKNYPAVVEKILYKSMLKMKEASQKGIIEYVLLKCIKSS